MATAEQLKTLIQSHFEKNDDRFKTTVLQLAAYEAKLGHANIAREIRDLVDKSKNPVNRVVQFNKDLGDLIQSTISRQKLSELVVSDELKNRVDRILKEFRQQEKLSKHGLDNRRKILLAGPPGTGKTMTASVIACELHLPLYTIMMDKLVTKFMGETSAKLRQIFETIKETQGIYLFDEFDAIGTERTLDNDVGEIRRVLNSFLQFIEQDDSKSIIIAATNNPKLLDHALFRRFDDVLHYKLPTGYEVKSLIFNRLSDFIDSQLKIDTLCKESESLSHAEIAKACDDAIKETILSDSNIVCTDLVIRMLNEKKAAYNRGDV